MEISIRQATAEDLPAITTLFRNTITTVNAKHYNEKQISVWVSVADDNSVLDLASLAIFWLRLRIALFKSFC